MSCVENSIHCSIRACAPCKTCAKGQLGIAHNRLLCHEDMYANEDMSRRNLAGVPAICAARDHAGAHRFDGCAAEEAAV